MSNVVNIDSTLDITLNYTLNAGNIDVLVFELPLVTDGVYTLILNEGEANEWVIPSNQMEIDNVAKTVSVPIDSTGKDAGVYTGEFKSQSKVIGIYFKCICNFTLV